jgi:transposase
MLNSLKAREDKELSHMNMEIERVDHLGVVAGVIQDLGLIEHINRLIPPTPDMKVSHGHATAAMILTGLGFLQKPLSLTPQFFENRPIRYLLGNAELEREDLNHWKLGRTLEALQDSGCESLFAQISYAVCQAEGVEQRWVHGDTTSFSLFGKYRPKERPEDALLQEVLPEAVSLPDESEAAVTITHGYSRDHRPDLVQIVQEMLVSEDSGIPLQFKCFSGNANDSEIFHQRLKAMAGNLQPGIRGVVLDAKGYNQRNAPYLDSLGFITRVPGTLAAHDDWVKHAVVLGDWQALDESNHWQAFDHEGERWIVVHSQAGEARATEALARKIAHEAESLTSQLKTLSRKKFGCEADAKAAVAAVFKKAKYHRMKGLEAAAHTKQAGRGRPKADAQKVVDHWRVTATFEHDAQKTQFMDVENACYIVATNVPADELAAAEVVRIYKEQSKVERGFRFLKDPQFFTSALFLKKPERIQGMLLVMTLALLVYSLAERRLRKALAELKQTLPNQIKQETSRPTLRWVFQLLDGINRVTLTLPGQPTQVLFQGITDLKRKILRLLGPGTAQYYHLHSAEGCSM